MYKTTLSLLDSLFPINFEIRSDFCIVSCSASMLELIPDIVGRKFDEIFVVRLPVDVESYKALRDFEGRLILLESQEGTIAIKGQLVSHWQFSSVRFVGVPWLSWMASRNPSLKLERSMFPVFDSQIDQEILISTQTSMIRGAADLASELRVVRGQLKSEQMKREELFRFLAQDLRRHVAKVEATIDCTGSLASNESKNEDKHVCDRLKFAFGNLTSAIETFVASHSLASGSTGESVNVALADFIVSVVGCETSDGASDSAQIEVDLDSNLPEFIRGDCKKIGNVLQRVLGWAKSQCCGSSVEMGVRVRQAGAKQSLVFSIFHSGNTLPSMVVEQFPDFEANVRITDPKDSLRYVLDPLIDASSLTEEIGGEMKLESSEKDGTRISIEVPLPEVGSAFVSSTSSRLYESVLVGSPKKVALVVSDCRYGGQEIGSPLNTLGIAVKFANDFDEALYFAEKMRFVMVLIDLELSQINAIEVARSLRESLPSLPLVAIGSNENSPLLPQDMEVRFDAVVRRVDDADEIADVIGSLLKGKSFNRQEVRGKVDEQLTTDIAVIDGLAERLGPEKFEMDRNAFIQRTRDGCHQLKLLCGSNDMTRLASEANKLASDLERYGAFAASRQLRALSPGSNASHDQIEERVETAVRKTASALNVICAYRLGT